MGAIRTRILGLCSDDILQRGVPAFRNSITGQDGL